MKLGVIFISAVICVLSTILLVYMGVMVFAVSFAGYLLSGLLFFTSITNENSFFIFRQKRLMFVYLLLGMINFVFLQILILKSLIDNNILYIVASSALIIGILSLMNKQKRIDHGN